MKVNGDTGIRDEIVVTLEALRELLDDLVIRGLQNVGSEEIKGLGSMRSELMRVGASHLAGRLDELITAIEKGGRESVPLLRLQTSLHLFAGIFSREVAAAQLGTGPDPAVS